jgi:L-lactate dehydrogenase (cytochrome)
MAIACVTDFRREAEKRLPRFLFDYIDGGAYAEVTLRRNVADLAEIALRQRVLVDVSRVDLSTRLFGCDLAMPVGLGPVGMSGMYARRGEAQAARAAAAKGIPICLSSVSVCDLREVAAAGANPLWFQLYVIRDRAYMAELLAVAKDVKCSALVFTVDLPVPGARYRDAHSGLTGANTRWKRLAQIISHPRWAWDVGIKGKPHSLGNFAPVLEKTSGLDDYVGWIGRNFDPSIAWNDIAWIRSHWQGPLLVKGILDVEDAREAVKLGADGIVLPGIADAVGGDLTILADGGIRSGLDVLRMLALGAKGVLLGRAWAYALAARGEAGVAHMLDIVEAELRVAMQLTGVTSIDKVDRAILAS